MQAGPEPHDLQEAKLVGVGGHQARRRRPVAPATLGADQSREPGRVEPAVAQIKDQPPWIDAHRRIEACLELFDGVVVDDAVYPQCDTAVHPRFFSKRKQIPRSPPPECENGGPPRV